MQWKEVKLLKDSHFQPKRGRPAKVSVENQLLIMLMYYRKYRTFLHTSLSYDISEAQCWRIAGKMETILINNQQFHLPGKKKMLENPMNWEAVVIDVGESPSERPKKTAQILFRQKEKAPLKNAGSSR